MKKQILIFGVLILSVLSCKKTFTCDCNATLSSSTVYYKHTLRNVTKKNADIECQNIEYNEGQEYKKNGGSYICDLR